MILYINTKDQKQISVSLYNAQGKLLKSLSEQNEFGSQVVLPLIEKILKIKQLGYNDIKGIEVETGPGSFTGLRVGISVANSLGFSLGIPVNGKNIETELKY